MSNPVNIPALLHSAKPAVQIEGGKVVTSSVEIARVFDKRHDDVLKAIRNLLSDLSGDYLRNFAEVSIEYQNGKGGTQTAPAYHLTRDGFTLLAMGFNGKKALAFKLAYIDAFNKMEAELTGKALPPPPPPVPTRTLTFTVPVGEIGHRWLLHTDKQGREIVTPLSPDTHIATPAKIVDVLMKSPIDLHVTYEQQLTIVAACLRNLQHAAAGHARRLDLKPAHPANAPQGTFADFGRPAATGAAA